MRVIVAYLGAFVTMLALDAVMILTVIRPAFEAQVPHLMAEEMNALAGALFFLIYPAGVVWFAVRPALERGSLGWAALNGGLLGGLVYLAYEATNLATLAGWSWDLLLLDTAWGAVLTAAGASAGFLAARKLGGRMARA